MLFYIAATPFYILIKKEYKSSLFSTSSLTFIICTLFDGGHSDWFGIIPHCSFDLHFSVNYQCWASLHVPLCHLCVFFGKNVYWSLLLIFLIGFFFFFLVCSCTKTVGTFYMLTSCWSCHLQIVLSIQHFLLLLMALCKSFYV